MRKSWMAALLASCCLCSPAEAHFGMLIPSASMIEDRASATLEVACSFSHPMEGVGMPLVRPQSVQVLTGGRSEELASLLQPMTIMGHEGWKAQYSVKRPGLYTISMTPQPYWEEAEDRFIVHYVKTCVAAYGGEEGWDKPVGLKTEIVPLTRPFGNYAGNVFQGRVLLDGRPVPHAEVEVEYYNRAGKYAAPSPAMVTQSIRADVDGVFTYAVPFAGWWGFAALTTASETMEHGGQPKEVELGAVIWAEFFAPVMK